MTPPVLHAPPRGFGAAARTTGEPSGTVRRSRWPSAKNPMERLSGDQKGMTPPAVPGRRCNVGVSSERNHRALPELNTTDLPSGAMTNTVSKPAGRSAGSPRSVTIRTLDETLRAAAVDAHHPTATQAP